MINNLSFRIISCFVASTLIVEPLSARGFALSSIEKSPAASRVRFTNQALMLPIAEANLPFSDAGWKVSQQVNPSVVPTLSTGQLRLMFEKIGSLSHAPIKQEGDTRIIEYGTGHYASFDGTTLRLFNNQYKPEFGFSIGPDQFTAANRLFKPTFHYSGGAPIVGAGTNEFGHLVIFGADAVFAAYERFKVNEAAFQSANILSHATPLQVDFRKTDELKWTADTITNWFIRPPGVKERPRPPVIPGLPPLSEEQLLLLFEKIATLAKAPIVQSGSTRIVEYGTGHYASFDGTTLRLFNNQYKPEFGFSIGPDQFTAANRLFQPAFHYSGGAPIVGAGTDKYGHLVIFGADAVFAAYERFKVNEAAFQSANILSHATPLQVDFRKTDELKWTADTITNWFMKPTPTKSESVLPDGISPRDPSGRSS